MEGHAHAHQVACVVVSALAVDHNAQNDRREQHEHSNRTDKAQLFTRNGKNKIVLVLRHSAALRIIPIEKALPEKLAGADRTNSTVLLKSFIFA